MLHQTDRSPQQYLFSKKTDGFPTIYQIIPVLLKIVRAREPTGDPNNRYILLANTTPTDTANLCCRLTVILSKELCLSTDGGVFKNKSGFQITFKFLFK